VTTTASGVAFAGGTRAWSWRRARLAAKRAFDLVVAVAALILLGPLLLLVAGLLLVTEGRPVLFRQRRVGRYGQPFTMLKFRTMVVDAEHQLHRLRHANDRTGPLFKMATDPRVTRIGQFLRATSLDELPQLVNVVAGTMSMVGPRPALYEERASFTPDLLAREDMPPGITGLWQVEARTEGDFDRYRQLDLQYVGDWSLRLDLWLLVKTPVMLVKHALAPTVVAAELPAIPSSRSTSGEQPVPTEAVTEATIDLVLLGRSADATADLPQAV
jgi:lipopolysaccharide/colanic/teichoic acid biosynthesis glycosyltransferase